MALIYRQEHRVPRGYRAVPALPVAKLAEALKQWWGERVLLQESPNSLYVFALNRKRPITSNDESFDLFAPEELSALANWARRRGWGVLIQQQQHVVRLTPLFGVRVYPCGQYLYHITDPSNVASIKRRGLIPRNIWTGHDAGAVVLEENVRTYPRRVYLTDSLPFFFLLRD